MGICISGCIRLLQWRQDRQTAYKDYVPSDQLNAPAQLTPAEKEPSVLLVFSILERQRSELKTIDFLKRVFAKNPNLMYQRNSFGETLLYFLCKEGNIETIRYLLKSGCPSDDVCSKGTALHGCVYAIHSGKMSAEEGCQVMATLIHRGCDINAQDAIRRTAFYLASSLNCIAAMAVLADKGCDISKVANEGMTSLHVAVAEINPQAVDFVLSMLSQLQFIIAISHLLSLSLLSRPKKQYDWLRREM